MFHKDTAQIRSSELSPRWRRRLISGTSALALVLASGQAQAVVFVNEFHYDNNGTDSGEFIEIVGTAGTDITGWSIVRYNGNNGNVYTSPGPNPAGSDVFSGILGDDTGSGFGFATVNYNTNGLQNGPADGFALVDNTNSVIQFLSYEGSFTANNGPAAGMSSADIGVSESGGTPAGASLQLSGQGLQASDFIWTAQPAATAGATNTNQVFDTPIPPQQLAIFEIQGAQHVSPFEGQQVETSGVVTALANDGFYLQDQQGDGDTATSDGIFVFTGGAPTVAVGDGVTVVGTVDEEFGSTEIDQVSQIDTTSSNNAIAPTLVGIGGRQPPTEIIDDTGGAVFDPDNHGRDFYESLEGMLVTVEDAQAVDNTNRFGQVYAIANNGDGTTTVNSRGGITISADPDPNNPLDADLNPERLLIDVDLDTGSAPDTNVGDGLGDITGVVDFGFNDYFIRPLDPVQATDGGLVSETSDLVGTSDQVTVASFNVLNLDPNDQDGSTDIANGQFADLAQQIVNNLNRPDIIGLQEVQDNTGSTNDGETSASLTYETLIQAIVDAGGPQYEFIDVPPEDGQDGGQPGGNIRVGYLYNPNRVELVPGSVERLEDTDGDDAFESTRKPVLATFLFNGEEITVINNHFSSKGGSDPLFGTTQPPANGSVDEREAQAQFVNDFVDQLLAADPDMNLIVLGDLNEFQFYTPLELLAGGLIDPVLFNLVTESGLDPTDIYSFIFEGNSQQLDHLLVSANLLDMAMPEFDIVHTNTGFRDQASDHDPILARFTFPTSVAAVPEPGSLALFLAALGGFWFQRRRRRLAA